MSTLASVREKVRLGARQLPYVPRALALVLESARGWTLAWLALLLARGALPVALVMLTRSLVNGFARIVKAGAAPGVQHQVLAAGLLMMALLLLGETLDRVTAYVRAVQGDLVQDHVSGLIHAQALSLDLSYFDDAGYYDRLHRARADAATRPVALLESAGSLAQNTITLVGMAAVLARFGILLPAALALGTLPALAVTFVFVLRFHEWRQRNTAAVRRTHYYDHLVTDHAAAAELRIFDLGQYFEKCFQDLRLRLRTEQAKLKRDEAIAGVAASAVGLLVLVGGVAWIARRAIRGLITMGDLALFVQSFYQGQQLMRLLLGSTGELYSNLTFLQNLFEFLELRPRIHAPAPAAGVPPPQGDIRLEGVTFGYPGTDRPALVDFSLTLPAGKMIAVVGENGAGKTTLIKLLCRFYDPVAGKVTFGGRDLRDIPLQVLRNRIAVLFQESVRYQDTVANNIGFGDFASRPGLAAIEAAAGAAGAAERIGRLPEGYGTVLGKWFGNAELSVGEWQRLALARAFLRQASLLILDEPTSAMDSWAEADWLARLRLLARGRSALIITHRFTTALHADLIHVMRRGRIVESGTHAELVAAGGLYAQSWKRQVREVEQSP